MQRAEKGLVPVIFESHSKKIRMNSPLEPSSCALGLSGKAMSSTDHEPQFFSMPVHPINSFEPYCTAACGEEKAKHQLLWIGTKVTTWCVVAGTCK
jgi:hypothetical protein